MASAKKSFFYRNKKSKNSLVSSEEAPKDPLVLKNDNQAKSKKLSFYPSETEEQSYEERVKALTGIVEASTNTNVASEIETQKTVMPHISALAQEQLNKNKEFLDKYLPYKNIINPLFSYVRQKTGKTPQTAYSLLEEIHQKKLGLNLVNESGTNFAGLCLLYEECHILEYAIESLGASEIEMPMILGMKNFHAIFNKSLLINECFVSLAKKKNVATEEIIQGLQEFAPSLLFRQENVIFYLRWFAQHALSPKDSEKLLTAALENNNRPLLAEAVKINTYVPQLQQIIASRTDCEIASENNREKDIILWLKNQLRHNAKSQLNKTTVEVKNSQFKKEKNNTLDIITPHVAIELNAPESKIVSSNDKHTSLQAIVSPQLSVEIIEAPQEIAHLSNLEDKLKFLTTTQETAKKAVIVKKKILSKPLNN